MLSPMQKGPVVAGLMLLLAGGCAPPASEGGFDSPSPGAKLYAIMDAARTNDRSAIAQLVEQLNSDDPLVRFAAIETLEQLTGETYGYDYADDELARLRAIGRWRRAVESGELGVEPPKSAEVVAPGAMSEHESGL